VSVVVRGESGTGKELIAKLLHLQSGVGSQLGLKPDEGSSSWPTEEPCSWMRSEIWTFPSRSNFCVLCRSARSCALVDSNR
jgi:hypothetical protein